ncbi:hypothetical protein DSTSK_11750 [Desulforhabdus sp. TSK]|nr:hypothetical protein DSTSK_11750 [Desulforhabdus sp. TSK]
MNVSFFFVSFVLFVVKKNQLIKKINCSTYCGRNSKSTG